eukprot:CAMPEP_0168316082 /NCGR_PEP_ID=MMETSP0210-20121227/14203_1 /TAXON_ID=40633 /ORGANISM="Condylostoma magnum, Strain COL2" /LENGTH=41 /DNA_ID= /DNA_START= /DNA_END= /DNA_ORIENTATION=
MTHIRVETIIKIAVIIILDETRDPRDLTISEATKMGKLVGD